MHECEISKLVETSRIRDVAQVFVVLHVVLLLGCNNLAKYARVRVRSLLSIDIAVGALVGNQYSCDVFDSL